MKSNNLQTIYVMWLREMKRFLRAKSRLIGTLAMPFFFLLAMGSGFNSSFSLPGAPPGVNYLNFLVPGILGMTMLFSSMSAGISVLWDKEFGFLKEIMVAPVRRSAIILGRIAGGVTTALIQGVLILILSLFLGFKIANFSGFILALFFMLLIGIGFIGFGVAIASKMEDTQGFSLIMQFIVFPIFLLSGAFFPVANFPGWIRSIAYLDPLTYGVDGLRSSLIRFSQFPLTLDLIILLIFGALMIALGSWLFSKTEI
jgi:ABC-2 type transport system permease protein